MRELFHLKTCGYLIQAVWSLRQSEAHIAACLKTAAISSRRSRTGPVRNCLMFRHDPGVPPCAFIAKVAMKSISFVEARLRRHRHASQIEGHVSTFARISTPEACSEVHGEAGLACKTCSTSQDVVIFSVIKDLLSFHGRWNYSQHHY